MAYQGSAIKISIFPLNNCEKKDIMKRITILVFSTFLFLILACEDVVVTYPGNNQSTTPVPPKGSAVWLIAANDDIGQLPENSAPGIAIATLNAEDVNPDDEFFYSITSQTIGNTAGNYFSLSPANSPNLILNSGSIDYEALSGADQVLLNISVSDDSPDNLKSDFTLYLKINNVNESPFFSNLNSVISYADENIEYSFNKLQWSDIDEGQNPTLSSLGPSWLSISDEGLMVGTPSSSNVGINSYVFSITDGEFEVTEEKNIEVRANVAPVFLNAPSSMSVTVGCLDVNDLILDLNWNDPNNSSSNFTGTDLVSFTVDESISWLTIDPNGNFLCVDAPTNSDAATSTIILSIEDNRPNNPKSTSHSFNLTVVANNAPSFTDLSDFPSEMNSDTTIAYQVLWDDPNEDPISIQAVFQTVDEESVLGTPYTANQLSWVDLDNSGNLTLSPSSSNAGDYKITFTLSDDCLETFEAKSFTIR